MATFKKINAPEILAVPICECGDPLVDLCAFAPDVFLDSERNNKEYTPRSFLLRQGVAERLRTAATLLPEGVIFSLIATHRPIAVQQELFAAEQLRLQAEHPSWGAQEIFDATAVFIAPPNDTPPHSTGGAIDLSLTRTNGEELDMGTDFSADYDDTCYTDAPNISEEACKNRAALVRAMEKAGFTNYPAEWWHWSYGDRYSAYHTGASCAVYGTVS